jgi:hypothetical protein
VRRCHPLRALAVDALLIVAAHAVAAGHEAQSLGGGVDEDARLALPFVKQPNSVFEGVGCAGEPNGSGLS